MPSLIKQQLDDHSHFRSPGHWSKVPLGRIETTTAWEHLRVRSYLQSDWVDARLVALTESTHGPSDAFAYRLLQKDAASGRSDLSIPRRLYKITSDILDWEAHLISVTMRNGLRKCKSSPLSSPL